MKPHLTVTLTADGDIRAALTFDCRFWLTMNRASGQVIFATPKRDSDEWRWLVVAARLRVAQASLEEYR